jgi:hypothetical protein
MNAISPIGIVGGGRVATHFSRYLADLGLPYRRWSRREGGSLAHALEGCRVAALLIRDDAIEAFAREHREELSGHRLVHFSGSVVCEGIESAHWLASFGEVPFPLSAYERIPFVVEKGRTRFADLFPGLPNPVFEIPAEGKPLYHALCVLSGNFTALLWRKAFVELEARFGLPREALVPYLESVMAGLAADPGRALTGPLARGDQGTIRANLSALASAGDSYEEVYRAMVRAEGHA